MAFSYLYAASALAVATAALLVARYLSRAATSDTAAHERPASGADPYAILKVPRDADKQAITKSYRALALKWHPDRNRGDAAADADAIFATISHAYDVLTDPEKREVFDRLGASGLERMRDGDPSVHKDWLPPDEVLRRLHNDGDEPFLQSLVTSGFAALGAFVEAVGGRAAKLAASLGVERAPTVVIRATEDATGATLASGDRAAGAVTFQFALNGKSTDFTEADVAHTCTRAKFLGMKTTFYLQCAHVAGQALAVSVAANAFSVAGIPGRNAASEVFRLTMA